MSRSNIAILGLLCLILHPVFAAEAPPPPGTPKEFSLPEKTTFTLDNGLKVTMVPFGRLPKVSMVLQVRAGNLNEGSATWLADLTGAMMQEGTTSLDSKALNRKAAELGGSIGISVGPETTSVSISSLSERESEAIALLADVVRNPALPEDELPRIRADFIRNLSISRVRPQGQAAVAFNARIYGDHPFAAVYPSEEQLVGYGIEDVRRFYSTNFGAQRSHLFVSGLFDPAEMRAAVEEHFAGWAPGPEVFIQVPTPSRVGSLQIIDRPGAPQSTLLAGVPVIGVDDTGYSRLMMANDILGGAGFLSRLFQNLREDKGYTYGASTSTSNNFRSAVWRFRADVATEATGPALAEFFKELARIQHQPPDPAEMDRIRGYRGGIFVLANASRGGIIGTLAFMDFHELPDSYLTEYLSRLDAVTAAQVNEVAESQWPVAEMTIVVVGDRSVIDGQLAELEELAPYLPD
jgi:predicted Zn-dependent peptidase